MKYLKKKIILKKEKTYSICSCGLSLSLPFCDGKHRELNENGNCSYKSIKIRSEKEINLYVDCANWLKTKI